jgi:hypothetical protein
LELFAVLYIVSAMRGFGSLSPLALNTILALVAIAAVAALRGPHFESLNEPTARLQSAQA